jgi:hypothetical protein
LHQSFLGFLKLNPEQLLLLLLVLNQTLKLFLLGPSALVLLGSSLYTKDLNLSLSLLYLLIKLLQLEVKFCDKFVNRTVLLMQTLEQLKKVLELADAGLLLDLLEGLPDLLFLLLAFEVVLGNPLILLFLLIDEMLVPLDFLLDFVQLFLLVVFLLQEVAELPIVLNLLIEGFVLFFELLLLLLGFIDQLREFLLCEVPVDVRPAGLDDGLLDRVLLLLQLVPQGDVDLLYYVLLLS